MAITSLAWFGCIIYVLFGFSMIFLALSFSHFLIASGLFILTTCAVIACAALHG